MSNDNYVIVSGPALSLSMLYKSQHLALIDAVTGTTVAYLKSETQSRINKLAITGQLDSTDELEAFLEFVVTVAKWFKNQYLSLTDANALRMADVITLAQTTASLKALAAQLEVTVTATAETNSAGKANSVRFTNANVSGLAQVKATGIVMTIKAADA
jgi:hypothetical protein